MLRLVGASLLKHADTPIYINTQYTTSCKRIDLTPIHKTGTLLPPHSMGWKESAVPLHERGGRSRGGFSPGGVSLQLGSIPAVDLSSNLACGENSRVNVNIGVAALYGTHSPSEIPCRKTLVRKG